MPGNLQSHLAHKASLNTLPVEILHEVCTLLPSKGLLPFRRVCHLFARIGAEHLLSTINLQYQRTSFGRATEIAGHPQLANHVKSLEFNAERLHRWEWGNKKSYTLEEWISNFAKLNPAEHTAGYVRDAYATYMELLNDESKIEEQGLCRNALSIATMAFQNLKHVTLRLADNFEGGVYAFRTSKDDVVLTRAKRLDDHRGVEEFVALLSAVDAAGICLESIHAGMISHHLLDQGDEALNVMKRVLKPLRTLHLSIALPCIYIFGNDDFSPDYKAANKLNIKWADGSFVEFLTSASNLRTLHIAMPYSKFQKGFHIVRKCIPSSWSVSLQSTYGIIFPISPSPISKLLKRTSSTC